MSSLDQRRSRQRSAAAFSLASTLVLATYGPIDVAAAATEAGDRMQKLEELQAEAIDRGWLLTLDDAEFTTNDAELSSSGQRRLNALAGFLKQHPKRSVAIDGYAGAGDYREVIIEDPLRSVPQSDVTAPRT